MCKTVKASSIEGQEMKRENPYNRLKRISAQWIADNVLYRHRKELWTLNLEKDRYDFKELRYHIETASSLGYLIELSTNDKGHVVFTYVKKTPKDLPWELK